MIWLSLVIALAVLACLITAWTMQRGRILRLRIKRPVIVTMKSGLAFRGVLFDSDHDALVLRNAEAIQAGKAHYPVDGELIVLREDIDYVQRP